MAKRKTRRGGGNPFAGRDARIAELEADSATLREHLKASERECNAEANKREQEVNALLGETEALKRKISSENEIALRIMAQAKATEARAREIEPRYQREIQFLRDTLHRLTASGFQIEQTYRVAD